jgi:hypothetical protein
MLKSYDFYSPFPLLDPVVNEIIGFSCPLNEVSAFYATGQPPWFRLLEKDGRHPN